MIRKLVHSPRLLWGFLLPIILTILCYPPRIHGYLNPYDEGQWLGAAQALLQHQKVYRDFLFLYGPLLPFVMSVVLKFWSPTVEVLRALFWFLNLTGVLAVYFCLLKFVKSPLVRLVFALYVSMVPWGTPVLTVPFAVRYGVGFLALLGWESSVLLSGSLAGLSFFVSQEVGVAAVLASGVFFALGPERRRNLSLFGRGLAAVLAFGLTCLALNGILGSYITSVYRITSQVIYKDRLNWPSVRTPEAWAMYSAILTYLFVLCWTVRKIYRKQPLDRPLLALTVYGILTAAPECGRTDQWHIYFALSPALVLWACLAERSMASLHQKMQSMAIGFLLIGAMVTVPPFWVEHRKDRWREQIQRQTMIDRLGPVKIPIGQANGYEYLVNWLNRHTKPEEPFLFFPYDGGIYFLANRPNPTRFPVLALAMTRPMREEAVRELEASSVRWVIWDTEDTAFHGVPMERFLPEVTEYLHSHYTPQERRGPFIFLERKSP